VNSPYEPPQAPPAPPSAAPGPGSALLGALLVMPLHLFAVPLAMLSSVLAGYLNVQGYDQIAWVFWPVFFIGLSQWLYLGPAIWIFWRKGRRRTAAGLAIGGGITLLLNSACFGTLWIS
jgi:hypothetical protein